jgi:effector-binding domain-containing protein
MADIRIVEEPTCTTAVIRASVPMAELTSFFDRAFGTVAAAVGEQGLRIVGPPFARYFGPPGERVELEAGFPVNHEPAPAGEVSPGTLPGGTAYQALHRGPYDGLAVTYAELAEAVAEDEDAEPTGEMWEYYVTDPGAEPDPGKWLTRIVQPLQ